MGYGPISHFTEIEAWKRARELRVAVYRVAKELPEEEKYALASQMRRAAISCSANIAEGYGRFFYQENIQFCRISRGSMYEIQDHLISCADNQYIAKNRHDKIWELSLHAIKVLNGYIRFLKKEAQKMKNQ